MNDMWLYLHEFRTHELAEEARRAALLRELPERDPARLRSVRAWWTTARARVVELAQGGDAPSARCVTC